MIHTDLSVIKIEKGEQSTVTISGEILFEDLKKHRQAALKHLGKDIKIDGFRKGHIPEKVLIERIGDMQVLSEMAKRALSEVYPEIVKQHNLDVVGYPKIQITKIADNNPLGFTLTVSVVPEITLPDVKQIAREQNKNRPNDEVTDKEVDDQIKDLLRQKVAYEKLQKKATPKTSSKIDTGNTTELPTPETVKKESGTDEDIPIPELTDEYVKTLGQPGQFNSVTELKEKIKKYLSAQKKEENASKHRANLTDAIIAASEMELPEVLIEAEMGQMFAQMEEDLRRAQLSMDDYLSHMKKTKEDLEKEWRPAAEKRAKLQLILNEIAKREHITPDKGAVDQQVSHLLEHYKDADETRVRTYVESVLANDAVLKMLEKQQ